MQLLDSEQLEYAFQTHGISLESEARGFYSDLWALIQQAEKVRDPAELVFCNHNLRKLCDRYFIHMRDWREGEQDRLAARPSCDLSKANASEAESLLPSFEKQFYRYALCYLELNRVLIQNRMQLSHFAKEYKDDGRSKNLVISNATGLLLNRAHKERQQIVEKRLRFERVRILLQHFDGPLEFLGAFLPDLYGQVEGDHQLTLFKGAIRKRHFDKAEHICKGWKDSRVREPALMLIKLARQHQDELQVQDSLMLHSGELSLITAFIKNDEHRMNQFMEKYNVPYMLFHYKNLLRQGYLLGRIGSIEGLMIQHGKLTALAARTHVDPDAAKQQEAAILVPARLLLDLHFKSLGAIFSDMETTCAILEKLFEQTREYERHSDLPQ